MLRRVLRSAATVVLIGVLCFAALEGVCRLFVLTNDTLPVDFVADPHLPYRLAPNSKVVSLLGISIQTNSLGLRDREFAVPKPAGVFRILAVGDSTTLGYGVAIEDTYAKRLERMLNEKKPGRYEVVNAGVSGYNTHDVFEYLSEYGLALQPDLILYGFPTDDFANDSMKLDIRDGIGYEPGSVALPPMLKKALRHSRLYVTVAYLANTIRGMRRPPPEPKDYFDTRWQKYQPDLDALKQLCKSRNLPLVVAYLPVRAEVLVGHPRYPRLLERLAEAQSDAYRFVDLFPVYQSAGDDKKVFINKDCCHASPLGHELIAKRLLGELVSHD